MILALEYLIYKKTVTLYEYYIILRYQVLYTYSIYESTTNYGHFHTHHIRYNHD